MKVRTELPGVVVARHAEVGDRVSEGQPIVTIETMKLEGQVYAPEVGRLTSVAEIGELLAPDAAVADLSPSRDRPANPSEVLRVALASGDRGRFAELDLAEQGLRRVRRPIGTQDSGIVVGEISHRFGRHTTRRVWLGGDSDRQLGAVSEPECRRIIAAIDHAEANDLPIEWVAVSSGARVSLTSGTENMDWCALVVRRIMEFTQNGGRFVIIVAGVNVGAQSYWNASATMLMHCAGMLVMISGTSMILTGSTALARSGGVPADSDAALGGYEEIMGPNGQAHHVVPDLASAYELVQDHYSLEVERPTRDPIDRDVCEAPLVPGRTVGEVLRSSSNPSRKQPYPVRSVMGALRDSDAPVLERWPDMAGAQGAVVWDTAIGGRGTTLIGIESQPSENGLASGPAQWAGCTLYPGASKKVARAITHASGRRPVVVLANLAGFDGSSYSLASAQLEWGAEIARSVINFSGRIVVVITGRFHGGAYVVFNKTLNDNVRMLALEGTRVSVIGGSSAAEVVLKKDVQQRAAELASSDEVAPHHAQQAQQEVAARFDEVHSVARAFEMGSVDAIIAPEDLRPEVIRELRSPTGPAPRLAGSRGSRARARQQPPR